MDSRFCIYMLFLVAYFILSRHGDKNANNFAKFCCFILFLESGLRHANVGPDTPTYFMNFKILETKSWSDLFSNYYNAYVLGIARDPSYPIIAKPFTYFAGGWQLFLLFAAGVYFYALYKFLTRYIESFPGMLLAFTFCISLFHIIPLSGMRQQFTMAISMFLPSLIERKKVIKYVIVVLVGSTIHTSLLFVLPLYFLYHYLPVNPKKFLILSFLCIPIVAITAKSILRYIVSFSYNEYYAGYITEDTSGAFRYIIFFTLIVFIAIYYFDKIRLKSKRLFCCALIMISLTIPLIVVNGAMIRISQYFTIYAMLFIPYIIQHSNDKLLYYMIITTLLYLVFSSNFEYHFFWENLVLNFRYK